ncbi:MAG: diaminopimelate decarboxylase, partial [Pseudomonadota bacterium]
MDRFQRGPNDCLSIRDGRLFLEDRGATELADTFGTPLYAISENRLRQNVREYREAFSRLWPEGRVDILPAVKANWIPALRKILTQEGAGCDVYSAGELHAALSSGADPEKISV